MSIGQTSKPSSAATWAVFCIGLVICLLLALVIGLLAMSSFKPAIQLDRAYEFNRALATVSGRVDELDLRVTRLEVRVGSRTGSPTGSTTGSTVGSPVGDLPPNP